MSTGTFKVHDEIIDEVIGLKLFSAKTDPLFYEFQYDASLCYFKYVCNVLTLGAAAYIKAGQ